MTKKTYTRRQVKALMQQRFPDAAYEITAFESLGVAKWRVSGYTGAYPGKPFELIFEREEAAESHG